MACTFHGLQAGKDVHTRAYEWVTVISVSVTMVLLLLRVVATRDRSRRGASDRITRPSARASDVERSDDELALRS